MTKLRLFSYVRVSTNLQNTETQEHSIKKFISAYDDKYEIIGKYEDKHISAFKERPQYEEMITKLFNDEADGVIIKELSRIGRSVKQLVNLIDRFNKYEKHLIVLDQNINTSSKEGRLFFHILAAIAQYEAELIRERMNAGLQRYKDEGGKIGRPKKVEDEKTIKTIIKLYTENRLGLVSISKFLKGENPPISLSPATIRTILKDNNIKIRGIYER